MVKLNLPTACSSIYRYQVWTFFCIKQIKENFFDQKNKFKALQARLTKPNLSQLKPNPNGRKLQVFMLSAPHTNFIAFHFWSSSSKWCRVLRDRGFLGWFEPGRNQDRRSKSRRKRSCIYWCCHQLRSKPRRRRSCIYWFCHQLRSKFRRWRTLSLASDAEACNRSNNFLASLLV